MLTFRTMNGMTVKVSPESMDGFYIELFDAGISAILLKDGSVFPVAISYRQPLKEILLPERNFHGTVHKD
jgi:hypothetical protein